MQLVEYFLCRVGLVSVCCVNVKSIVLLAHVVAAGIDALESNSKFVSRVFRLESNAHCYYHHYYYYTNQR